MQKLASSFIGPVATMEQRQRQFIFETIMISKPAKKARQPRRKPINTSEVQPF